MRIFWAFWFDQFIGFIFDLGFSKTNIFSEILQKPHISLMIKLSVGTYKLSPIIHYPWSH